LGYAEGSVELEQFAAMVQNSAALLAGSRVVVLDGASSVVADSASKRHVGSAQASSAPIFDLKTARPLRTSALDERGELMRAAFEPGGASLPAWRVVAMRSQRGIDENARRTRNEAWLTAGALWLLVFLVGAVVAGRFGRRLADRGHRERHRRGRLQAAGGAGQALGAA
jgi:hypothetical protein